MWKWSLVLSDILVTLNWTFNAGTRSQQLHQLETLLLRSFYWPFAICFCDCSLVIDSVKLGLNRMNVLQAVVANHFCLILRFEMLCRQHARMLACVHATCVHRQMIAWTQLCLNLCRSSWHLAIRMRSPASFSFFLTHCIFNFLLRHHIFNSQHVVSADRTLNRWLTRFLRLRWTYPSIDSHR